MKNSKSILFLTLISCLFIFNSCKDDDPIPVNGEEVITTLNYILTPTTGDVVTLSFLDLDGDGGNAPTISGGTLQANMTYTGVLDLKNESEDPGEDISAEVKEEDEDHQFFFSVDGDLKLNVAYDDVDADGKPVGLETTLTTLEASTGTLTIVLRHEPNKSADGVADGTITNAGGETDIEVSFAMVIE